MKLKDLTIQEIKGIWGDEVCDGEIGTPVIKTNNMTYGGRLDLNELTYRRIPSSKAKNCYLIDGDLLIEKSGGTKTHSVGYVNIFNGENRKYVANNFILILRPDQSKILPSYLFYQLRYRYESGQIEHLHNQTTGIQNLKVQMYLDQDLKCPSKEKQKNTILVLEKIEQDIELEQIFLRKLDELTKSRFNEMFGDPLQNEKGFNVVPLKELSAFNSVKGKVQISDRTWLLNLDMVESSSGRIIEKLRTSKVDGSTIEFDTNCVLYSKLRPYLNKVVIPDESGFATSEMVSLRCDSNRIKREYLATALRHKSFVDFINSKTAGAKMPRANMDELRKFKMPLPPFQEQQEFSRFIAEIDKLKF